MENCDPCGCEIPPGAEVRDIVTERMTAESSRSVVRTLCPECARRRAGLAGFVFQVVGLLLVGMVILGLVGWLVH